MATIEKQPDSPIVMMIDIETLGLDMRSFVTQVGVAIANTETREYLVPARNFWLSAAHQQDRAINFDTVRWWMGQDPKVSAGVFNAPKLSDRPGMSAATGEDRVSPQELFHILETLVKQYEPMVYASPVGFDLPILTDLFGGRKPWKYNVERDMMTLYKLLDPRGELQPPPNDMGHDAAADAHWQTEYLFNLLEKLRVTQQKAWHYDEVSA